MRVGLIGAGIGASRSPALHMAEARALGLDLVYELIDIEQRGVGPEALPALLDEVERRGFAGVNITHPLKRAVLPLLDDLSPDAAALGAVNTVVLRDGRRHGHNTDWTGFRDGFRRALPAADLADVVQLGAGGAGSAVAHAALVLGTRRLGIFDPVVDAARRLVADLTARFPDRDVRLGGALPTAMAPATGLIHATPTGMAGHPGLPLPADLLRPAQWVAEIVYFPLETELLRVARAKGCATADGGGMAVFQAVEAFRLFTGLAPDAERMLRHFASM